MVGGGSEGAGGFGWRSFSCSGILARLDEGGGDLSTMEATGRRGGEGRGGEGEGREGEEGEEGRGRREEEGRGGEGRGGEGREGEGREGEEGE